MSGMPSKTSSVRFCLNCQKETEWAIDKIIRHSRCKECGISSRYAKGKRPKDNAARVKEIEWHRRVDIIKKKDRTIASLRANIRELKKELREIKKK